MQTSSDQLTDPRGWLLCRFGLVGTRWWPAALIAVRGHGKAWCRVEPYSLHRRMFRVQTDVLVYSRECGGRRKRAIEAASKEGEEILPHRLRNTHSREAPASLRHTCAFSWITAPPTYTIPPCHQFHHLSYPHFSLVHVLALTSLELSISLCYVHHLCLHDTLLTYPCLFYLSTVFFSIYSQPCDLHLTSYIYFSSYFLALFYL